MISITRDFFMAASKPRATDKPATPADRRWNVRQVAEYLNVSVKTVRRWHDAGSLPAGKQLPGVRSVRWDPEKIKQWWAKLPNARESTRRCR